MKSRFIKVAVTILATTIAFFSFAAELSAQARKNQISTDTRPRGAILYDWQTVVNNGTPIPGNGSVNFGSYSQPSVNSFGAVVFRGRSVGNGQRSTGIFLRESLRSPLVTIADLNTLVPYPNNLDTQFQEFSAIPRIAMNSLNIATIGLHQPVYRYMLPDGTETRAGTTGIYARLSSDLLITGMSKLGTIPDFSFYSVAGHKELPFDVFPGAPTITDDGTIAFKGNYTVNGVGKTGVFVRHLENTAAGGYEWNGVVANSDTEIPNMPTNIKAEMFGSTAPPSAAGNRLVFLGLDNEDDPHFGGIYTSYLKGWAGFEKVLLLGETVPGTKVPELSRIGEGLSFDGRYIAFWAAWGKDMKTVRLYCPVDGNRDIIRFCEGQDPLSIFDKETGRWYQEKLVPVNQGIFLYDMDLMTGYLIADNNQDFTDFVFWVYSGHVPAPDEPDAEPPRWRSASFAAVSDGRVVFKARTAAMDEKNTYINPLDGIYLGSQPGIDPLKVIVETGMEGGYFDPDLNRMFRSTLPIIGLGIERDGFRGNYLAITLTMGDGENSWGGIYLADVGATPIKSRDNVKLR